MLWRLTKPNLPGWVDTPATSTPRGSNSAWKCGRVDAPSAATSTRASTATGRPSTTISGLRSALTIVGSASAASRQAEEHVDQRVAVDGRLAAELAEQPLGGEVVDHLARRLAR